MLANCFVHRNFKKFRTAAISGGIHGIICDESFFHRQAAKEDKGRKVFSGSENLALLAAWR
jgi:hypothetical protein